MAGEISPETQAILDALDNHGSKAGVRVVRGADGSVNLIEVDKDGKPVLGADGQPTQIPLTPKKPSQFTLNEKRYQLDENGASQPPGPDQSADRILECAGTGGKAGTERCEDQPRRLD
jgi:hypothetical protein